MVAARAKRAVMLMECILSVVIANVTKFWYWSVD